MIWRWVWEEAVVLQREEMCLWGELKVRGHRLECCIPVIFQVCRVTNIVNDRRRVYGGPESSKHRNGKIEKHNHQYYNPRAT